MVVKWVLVNQPGVGHTSFKRGEKRKQTNEREEKV